MDYYEARRIRKQGFTSLLARKLAEGDKGIIRSVGATLSERSKARMTGIKETFDPLNIAKFLTFGSKLGPALLGNLLGRTKTDISYFTGLRPTSTKINRLESDDKGLNDMLGKILTYMQTTNEENRKNRQKENNYKEELELERLKRHKELIAALTGRKIESKASLVKVQEPQTSLTDSLLGAFGLAAGAATAFKWLGKLGMFLATNPIVLGAGSAIAFGYALYKMLTDERGYEAKDSDLNRGLGQAQKVGGLAGVNETMEKRAKLPEYERTMEDIKDFQKFNNQGEPANDAQLTGFANRGTESARAVQDYKKMRDAGEIPKVTPVLEGVASQAVTVPEEVPNVAPPAVESAPASGQQLERSQSDNLNLKLQDKTSQQQDVINTRRIDNAMVDQVPVPKNLPAVRNLEPTLESMLLGNTRTV
jgi:hypothetical protein